MPSFSKLSAKTHLKEERIHPGWVLVEMVHIYVLFNPFQVVRTLFKKKKTMKPRKRGRPDHNGNRTAVQHKNQENFQIKIYHFKYCG